LIAAAAAASGSISCLYFVSPPGLARSGVVFHLFMVLAA